MFGIIEICIVLLSIVIIWLVKIIDKNPPPIFGVYQRPNGLYWLKVANMTMVLSLRKFLRPKQDEQQFYENIEKPQALSHHEKAIDGVYFNGANKNGDHLVVGTARRKNLLVDGFMYLKINSSTFGVLETPKLPSTDLYQTEEEKDSFEAEGIKITPIEPMKKWKLSYVGKMKELRNPSVAHDVKIESTWSSDLPYFNFDKDMDAVCTAKAIAAERWGSDYFESIEKNHQTHYEQFGTLEAEVTIDEKIYNIKLDSVRDHSFGIQREWRQFHRYALHFGTTEDGDHFSLGVVSTPISFSRITVGYIYSAKDKKNYPVKYCDLQLYQHGILGTPPNDFAFIVNAGDKRYTIQVNVVDKPHFYISKDWSAKIYEGLCTFEMNGKKGWGAAEWQYRNIQGRAVQESPFFM